MKQTKTLEYALALLEELNRKQGEYVEVGTIARKRDLPAPYCQKILLKLARAGVVESLRGQGFMLIRPVEAISSRGLLKALMRRRNDPACEAASRILSRMAHPHPFSAHPVF